MINQDTEKPLALANELRPVLLRLTRELRRETEQFGITGRQATLLWLVKGSPGTTMRALAEMEGISPPALSGHIDRLERSGLLVRVRSTEDRRRVGLLLTEEGERILRSVRERRTAWLAERLGELDRADLQAVGVAVEPLRRLLEVKA
jgi:DNA-binding MarR family transcriptional regulator